MHPGRFLVPTSNLSSIQSGHRTMTAVWKVKAVMAHAAVASAVDQRGVQAAMTRDTLSL
jgi:hypothetical protein